MLLFEKENLLQTLHCAEDLSRSLKPLYAPGRREDGGQNCRDCLRAITVQLVSAQVEYKHI